MPTLAELKPRFIEGHAKANRLKPSTAEAYESVLEPAFGSLRLDVIGDELVQRFKGELVEDGVANKSINNVLTGLSVMPKRAVEWKVIDAMPCRIRQKISRCHVVPKLRHGPDVIALGPARRGWPAASPVDATVRAWRGDESREGSRRNCAPRHGASTSSAGTQRTMALRWFPGATSSSAAPSHRGWPSC